MDVLAIPQGDDAVGDDTAVLVPATGGKAATGGAECLQRLRLPPGAAGPLDVRISSAGMARHVFATLEVREAAAGAVVRGPIADLLQRLPHGTSGLCFLGRGILCSLGLEACLASDACTGSGATVRIEAVPHAYRIPHVARLVLRPAIGTHAMRQDAPSLFCPVPLARRKLAGRLVTPDTIVALPDLELGERTFRIAEADWGTRAPTQAHQNEGNAATLGRISAATHVILLAEPQQAGERRRHASTVTPSFWPQLQVRMLRHVLSQTGSSSAAILLSGPSGCGKKTLLLHLCDVLGCEVILLQGDSVQPSGMEQVLHRALGLKRCVIAIMHAELYFPAPNEASSATSTEDVTALLLLMRDLPSGASVVLVSDDDSLLHSAVAHAATSHIRLGPPELAQREVILGQLLKDYCLTSQECSRIAGATHNMSIADLQGLCFSAAVHARRRIARARSAAGAESVANGDAAALTISDFARELPAFQQGTEVQIEGRTLRGSASEPWEGIFGQKAAKAKLDRAYLRYRDQIDLCSRMNLRPPRGILLYGLPGTGKTTLARGLALTAGVWLIPVRVEDLTHGEVGESEKRLHRVFQEARRREPCIVLIDDMHVLFGPRDLQDAHASSLVTQLLLELDELAPGVTLVGTTTRPSAIDPALVRAGRMEEVVDVSLPDSETRLEVLQRLGQEGGWGADVDFAVLAQRTLGKTVADLGHFARRAALAAVAQLQGDFSGRRRVVVDMEILVKSL